jgi:hypothetical protein
LSASGPQLNSARDAYRCVTSALSRIGEELAAKREVMEEEREALDREVSNRAGHREKLSKVPGAANAGVG